MRTHPAGRLGGTAGLAAAILLGLGPAGPVPAPPAPAAEPPRATVTVVGPSAPAGEALPSGHQLARVPGWQLPPGARAGPATVAPDGTVLVAGSPGVISGYDPETGAAVTVRPGAGPAPTAGPGAGAEVTGLAPLAGTDAVAFTTGGGEPALGVLANADGRWEVTSGDGWANQWRAADLGLDPAAALGEPVRLPSSWDLVAVRPDPPGGLVALRLTGPDPDGRFTVAVTGRFDYPQVHHPATGQELDLTLRELRADPTGRPGDERFVVVLQDTGAGDGTGSGREQPLVLQEFSYDSSAGDITPVSAPTVPGDRSGADGPWFGFSAAAYDRAGNLWAARHRGLAGGKLAVYAATEGQPGGLDRPGCRHDPAAAAGGYQVAAGGQRIWGQACRPDYDILQAQELPAMTSLLSDPAGGVVVGVTLAGLMLPVRPAGAGADLSFQVGNVVDLGLRLLPGAAGSIPQPQPGAAGADGRLWFPVAQEISGQPADQWLYGVDTGELFEPVPVPLPEVPGRSVTVQAGYTATTGTEHLSGSWAAVDVDSQAYVRSCTGGPSRVGCSYDGVPGNGLMLGHRSGFGHLAGEVAYQVEVPVPGDYRVAYRVFTFDVTTDAAITLATAGQRHTTVVSTGGRWRTVPAPEPVTLPAGVHTLRLAPPAGGGGWYLSWLTLQRA